MKLDLNTKQLELLEFIMSEFKCQDDEERAIVDSIEAQIYDVKEEDILRAIGIMKAQKKHPEPEW